MIARFLELIAKFRASGAGKLIVPSATALFFSLLATFAVDNIPFLTNAERFVSDGIIALFNPPEPQDPDVIVVDVNDDTMQQFQYREPLDRAFISNLLKALEAKGVRAIGLDYFFDQATEPAKDAELKKTIAELKVPLVISYTESANVVTDDQLAFLKSFVPPNKRAAVNLATDQFDVARWINPGIVTRDGKFLMSFPRAIAAAAGVKTTSEQIAIAWHGKPNAQDDAIKEFPAQAAAVLPAEWFKGKIVLVGSDLSLTDRHRTPFSTIYDTAATGLSADAYRATARQSSMAGVLIQANALAQLLHGKKAPYLDWWSNFAIALLLGAIGAALGMIELPVWLRAGGGGVVVLAFCAGCIALFHFGGPLVALLAPVLASAGSFWAMESLSGNEARAQREFVKNVFSHHVAPKVVEQLLNDPAKMNSLEGERRAMTFLFTDIADFTTMSETVESKELARILNSYLDGMTEIVQKHGGMVDKFIGDAVFAIFNAPVDLPDYAMCAVNCALEMDRFSESFCAEQNAQNIPLGRTRIGVHSGTAVVGNFGSRTRHNYTASGDAVNTASRLEGLNKHFGTRIAVSDATRVMCKGIKFRPIASVVMKGKTTAIDVWEPLQENDTRLDFIGRYCQAFALLEADAPDAMELFEKLEAEQPDDPCVALHLGRLREGIKGVALKMTEK